MKHLFSKTAIIILLAGLVCAQDALAQGSTIKRRNTNNSNTTTVNTSGGNKKKGERKKPTTTPVDQKKKKKVDPMSKVTITKLQIGNTDYDGDVIDAFGTSIYAADMKYATPKITYNCTAATGEVTIYSKIYRPDGTMMTGNSSPDGYTTSDGADFDKGNGNAITFPGWGNADGGSYTEGTYRWELWYNDKRLYSTNFTLLEKPVEAANPLVGFEYYGTSRDYEDNAKALPYITDAIREWGDEGCRTGAITEDERGVAITGDNSYAYTSAIPQGMVDKLKEYKKEGNRITDVTVTDSGWWCIVWGDNGYWGLMPDKMKELMSKYNTDREVILSVSICENGNFAIVTNKHFYASHETDNSNMQKALDKFGPIYSVSITNKGIVICCENGVYYQNIPSNVEEAIKEQKFRPRFVKYTDSGTYLITDGDKLRSWYM